MKNFLIGVFIVALVGAGCYFGYQLFRSDGEVAVSNIIKSDLGFGNEEKAKKEEEEEPKIKIFHGDDRPIAFMIDNNVNAQPQASINEAYCVYEIIVEGNETRLMALFKGKDCESVGPIRSARHYFLNYALEHDAIYAHLGQSPQAEKDIKSLNIPDINGQIYDTGKAKTASSRYWRVQHKKAPHNAYTNIPSIISISKDKKFSLTSKKKSVLNYSTEEVNLGENAITCNSVTLPYAAKHIVKYVYDEDTMRYTRYSKGKKMSDEVDKNDITTKNIIVTFAKNYDMPDTEDKGRQEVEVVGTLDGYYITNGKAIKIKCVKSSRSAQTVYKDLDGNEIEVNDGNTFINIVPLNANVTFE